MSQAVRKPGFFRANQTDKRRYKTMSTLISDNHEVVGRIMDIHEKKRVTLECQSTFTQDDELYAIHPKIDRCLCQTDHMWDINNKSIQETQPGELVQLPWVKGMQQNAWVVRIK